MSAGKPPVPPSSGAPAPVSWPVPIYLNNQDCEVDITLAAHPREWDALTRRKAAKGWQVLSMYPAPGYQGGQFQILWYRPKTSSA